MLIEWLFFFEMIFMIIMMVIIVGFLFCSLCWVLFLLVKDTLSYTVNGVSRGLPRYYVKLLKALFGDDVIKSMLLDRARDYTAQLEDEYRATKDPYYVRPDLEYLARGLKDDFVDWLKATAQVKYNRLVFNLNKLKRRDVYG